MLYVHHIQSFEGRGGGMRGYNILCGIYTRPPDLITCDDTGVHVLCMKKIGTFYTPLPWGPLHDESTNIDRVDILRGKTV